MKRYRSYKERGDEILARLRQHQREGFSPGDRPSLAHNAPNDDILAFVAARRRFNAVLCCPRHGPCGPCVVCCHDCPSIPRGPYAGLRGALGPPGIPGDPAAG